jgi:hypothetical protein
MNKRLFNTSLLAGLLALTGLGSRLGTGLPHQADARGGAAAARWWL